MGNFQIIISHFNDISHYNGAEKSDRFPEKIGKNEYFSEV